MQRGHRICYHGHCQCSSHRLHIWLNSPNKKWTSPWERIVVLPATIDSGYPFAYLIPYSAKTSQHSLRNVLERTSALISMLSTLILNLVDPWESLIIFQKSQVWMVCDLRWTVRHILRHLKLVRVVFSKQTWLGLVCHAGDNAFKYEKFVWLNSICFVGGGYYYKWVMYMTVLTASVGFLVFINGSESEFATCPPRDCSRYAYKLSWYVPIILTIIWDITMQTPLRKLFSKSIIRLRVAHRSC